MNNIIKLLSLDKAMLKPYYKYYILIFITPVVMTLSFKEIINGMTFGAGMAAMTCVYTFQIAEKNDINKLYGILPVNKTDIVTGRYLFTAAVGVLATLVSLLLNMIVLKILKVPVNNENVLIGIGISVFLYFLLTAVQLPGYFKFGAIKGKMFSYVPFVGMFAVVFLLSKLQVDAEIPQFLLPILNSAFGLLMIVILGSVVVYGISMSISIKIYQQLET